MKLLKVILTAAALAVLFSTAARAQLTVPKFDEAETGVQKIQFIETGETVYNIRWKSALTVKDGRTQILVQTFGDNDKQGKERIEWTEESLMETTPKGLRSQYWNKKSTGAEQMTWTLKYDWNAKTAYYTWSDALTGKKEEKTLSFTESAMSGDAMYWILRGFPFEKGTGHEIKGQMVMTDGTILEGKIIHRGEEKLRTAFGELETYKLELKPAGTIMGIVAPKMYMWYSKSEPHILLRFDGREADYLQPRTKNVLIKYEPDGRLKP